MNIFFRLVAISNCEKNKDKLTYVHTPLKEKTFEEMFNLGASYKKIKDIKDKTQVRVGGLLKTGDCLERLNTPNILSGKFELPDFSNDFRIKMIKKLNKKYFKTQTSKKLTFCIHLRRGDAYRKNPQILRAGSDNFLQRCLDTIKSRFNKHKNPPLINIHSDSEINMEGVKTYTLNVVTKFDVKPEEAMSDMISCDCLFRYGISAFSGVAAFYNQNFIISEQPKGYEGLYKMDNVFEMKDFKKINFTR